MKNISNWRQKSFLSVDNIFYGIRKALPESELKVRRGGATCHLNHSPSSADRGWGISWSRVGYQLIAGGVSADRGWGISW
jgi:hypothetical protein